MNNSIDRACSPAFRRSRTEQPNAPGFADTRPAEAGYLFSLERGSASRSTSAPPRAFYCSELLIRDRSCCGSQTRAPLNRYEAGTTYSNRKSQIANLKSKIPTLLTILTILVPVHAFPPTPHHLLFGTVRDEMGNPLAAQGAEVILETPTGTSIKTTIVPGLDLGVNYKLAVPLDAGVTSDIYRPTALRATAAFKMRVRIGQTVYLPIEMSGEFSKLGQPAQSTRFDLTLGEDSDGDGLPDAWERALLAASGAQLKDVRPGDDPDGDGLNNLNEYLAGTYAFDNKDGFSLKVVEFKASAPTLEFMSIRGRTYTVFGSSDLGEWAQVPFRFSSDSADAADRQNYQASDSRVVRVSVRPPTEQATMRFFKLRVE